MAVNRSLLDQARELASRESGLAVVVTYRSDGSAHASVMNAGVLEHPITKKPVIGFVVQGGERRKLANLRARPATTVVFRSGWDWVGIEGDVELISPSDLSSQIAPEAVADLFHEIYAAAIGRADGGNVARGGGGGGSGFGPAGVQFQTGVRSGNGLVTITFTAAAASAGPTAPAAPVVGAPRFTG